MPLLIEKGNEVMKEHDGEVEAVLAGKDCDLSRNLNLLIMATLATLACLYRSDPNLLCVGTTLEHHAPVDSDPLVLEANGMVNEDILLEPIEDTNTPSLSTVFLKFDVMSTNERTNCGGNAPPPRERQSAFGQSKI